MIDEFNSLNKESTVEMLIVDEAQDANIPQLTAIEKIAKNVKDNHFYLVGDPDQTIYEYAGSDADYFHKEAAHPWKELKEGLRCSEIINEYCNKQGGGIVFVCVMKGGFMFFSDLVKHIEYPIEIDFIRCSSYDGQEQKEIAIQDDIETNIKDKTVFIIDDILDSGQTMKFLIDHFKKLGAIRVETVSAVYKENVDFPNHLCIYTQPENENPWYIGYGMDDYKGYQRNLDTIYKL